MAEHKANDWTEYLAEVEARDFRDYNERHCDFDKAYDGWKQCLEDRRRLIARCRELEEALSYCGRRSQLELEPAVMAIEGSDQHYHAVLRMIRDEARAVLREGSAMRKIVCPQCAKDWEIQHCCAFGVSNAKPTVIWEPAESDGARIKKLEDALRKYAAFTYDDLSNVSLADYRAIANDVLK